MAAPPEPPGTPVLSNAKLTTLTVTWGPPSDDHGAAVDDYQLDYWVTGDTHIDTSHGNSRTRNLTGLIPGYEYNFKVRAHNRYGWGNFSPQNHGTMTSGLRVRYAGAWHIAVPYVRYNGTWHEAQPLIRSGGAWHGTQI